MHTQKDYLPMYMHEISNFKAGIENFSFSSFTKSNAIFSIFSRNIVDVQFMTINLSKPLGYNCHLYDINRTFDVAFEK